jgi:hypothetical protein
MKPTMNCAAVPSPVSGAIARGASTLITGVVVTLVGCATDTTPGDDPGGPRRHQPSARTDDGPIIINGLNDDGIYTPKARTNEAEIAALTSQALASQGKDNGQPVKAPRYVRTTAEVRGELETNRSQIAECEAARRKLFEDERYYAYPSRPNLPDPDKVAELDKQLGDLKARRVELEAELATLVAVDERDNKTH